MNDLVLTPGPWGWRQPAGSREINLCSVGRGMLYVLSPARAGMNGATILFGHRTAKDRGGLLEAVPVREHGSPDYLRDGELTPDARLIQAAPDMRLLLLRALSVEALPADLASDIIVLLQRVTPSKERPDDDGLTVAAHVRERELMGSPALEREQPPVPAAGHAGAPVDRPVDELLSIIRGEELLMPQFLPQGTLDKIRRDIGLSEGGGG